MERRVAWLAAGVLGVAMAVAGAFVAWSLLLATGGQFADCAESSVAGGEATIGGPFTLTNGAGDRVTEADVISKPTLIYFGYSFCPDVCPVDLARNAATADILAEQGIDVGLLFISIDPERDTPEIASEYAAYIHPEMVGLSGSPEDVAAAATAYRVYWNRGEGEDDFYLMDHSTYTYLAAPGHPFLEFFSSAADSDTVAETVACFVEAL